MRTMYDKMIRMIVSGVINDKEEFIDKMTEHIERSARCHRLSPDEVCDILLREEKGSAASEETAEAEGRLRNSIDALTAKIDELIHVLDRKV